MFVAKVKNGFLPRNTEEHSKRSSPVGNRPMPVRQSSGRSNLAMGTADYCGEDEGMSLGQAEAGLPGRVRGVDWFRSPQARYFPGDARR